MVVVLIVLVALLVVFVVGAIGYFTWKAEQARKAAIRSWAETSGWRYTASSGSWVDRFEGDPFGRGHTRRAENLLSRDDAPRTVVFDYSYRVTRTNGKTTTTTTYEYSVYAQQLPAALPEMSVEPEGFWDKTVKLFGGQDVELESVEFNDRYRVRAANQKVAYDVLNARTMESLLAVDGVELRIEGDWLLAVENGDLDVLRIPGRVGLLDGIVERIPSFVWKDHGAAPDGGAA